MMLSQQLRPVPHIDIVILRDLAVGKSTFISKLPHVQHRSIAKKPTPRPLGPTISIGSPTSSACRPPSIEESAPPPPYTVDAPSLPAPPFAGHPSNTGTHAFTISLYGRPYTITLLHNTTSLLSLTSDTHLSTVTPSLAVFTYAIPSRPSLHNVLHHWSRQLHQLYPDFDGPVLLLGLKRDLRTVKQISVAADGTKCDPNEVANAGVRHGVAAANGSAATSSSANMQYESVMPQEGLEAARLLHADRYAECSAVTGELIGEVLEDLTRMAAETTVDGGAWEQGWGCCMM